MVGLCRVIVVHKKKHPEPFVRAATRIAPVIVVEQKKRSRPFVRTATRIAPVIVVEKKPHHSAKGVGAEVCA